MSRFEPPEIPVSVLNEMMSTPKSSIIDMSTSFNEVHDGMKTTAMDLERCIHSHCARCCAKCNPRPCLGQRAMIIDRLAIIITIMALVALGLMATFMILSLTNLHSALYRYLFLASAITCPILFFVSTAIGSRMWTHKNRSWNLDHKLNSRNLRGMNQPHNGGLDAIDTIKSQLKKALRPVLSTSNLHPIQPSNPMAETALSTPPPPPPPPPHSVSTPHDAQQTGSTTMAPLEPLAPGSNIMTLKVEKDAMVKLDLKLQGDDDTTKVE